LLDSREAFFGQGVEKFRDEWPTAALRRLKLPFLLRGNTNNPFCSKVKTF